jgi:hypothetical protein
MEDRTRVAPTSTQVIRWIARVWSIASIVLVLLFIVIERDNPASTTEWIGFLFFPAGICAGMIAAWRMELMGGTMTIGSLAIFYAYCLATTGTLPNGLAWLVFSVPGFLFLFAWFRSRRRPPQRERIVGTSFIDPC